MLGDLENKLAAVVADGVSTRVHLTVGVTPMDPPDPGKGTVAVGLSIMAAQSGFAPSLKAFVGPPASPQSRRVLPVRFRADIAFASRPATTSAADTAAARGRLAEDLSAVAYFLSDDKFGSGEGFVPAAADPGFRVDAFELRAATLQAALDGASLTARLTCGGSADIWPTGALADEGVIRAVDPAIVALPLAMRVADARVRPGGATTVTLASPHVRRLIDAKTGARGVGRVAVTVLADVPPAQRGVVTAGVPGAETGVRVLDLTASRLVIPYQAPAADPGPMGRLEYVAVHLATPGNDRGLFLGSAAIQLVGAP